MATTVIETQRIGQADAAVLTAQATLGALNDAFGDTLNIDAFQSVSVQVSGTFVGSVAFEVSNDGVTWHGKVFVSNAGAAAAAATGAGIWSGDLGARYFRTRMSAYTSGTATVSYYLSPESQSYGSANTTATVNALTPGTGAAQLGKAEDTAHASGDVGVLMLGVRQPTAPVIPTSAANDNSYILLDQEGKTIISGTGAAELSWQAAVDLTTTSSTALIAAAGAGIRRYVTDMTFANTGASPATVTVFDGAGRVYVRTIPATSSVDVQLKTPIRGTAATAVNASLAVAGTVTVSIAGYIGI